MQGFFATILVCLLLHPFLPNVSGDDPPEETTTQAPKDEDEGLIEVYNQNNSYCFQFTWLGQEYDNFTKIDQNTTCEKIIDDKRSKDVPCRQPLVITDNGGYPDMNYLWKTYKMRVACKRNRGYVCAKYLYKFNNAVLNATYMCTKVSDENEGPITRGCYRQTVRGIDSELCVCESVKGDYMPCNSARDNTMTILLLWTVLVFIIGKM